MMKNLPLLILLSSAWSSHGMAYTSACVTKTVISAICDSHSGPVARADVYELVQNPDFKDSSDPKRICKSEQYDAFFTIWLPTENGNYERVVNQEMFGPKQSIIDSADGQAFVQFDQNSIRAYYMSPEETSFGQASALSVHRKADASIVGSLRLGKSIKYGNKSYVLNNCNFIKE